MAKNLQERLASARDSDRTTIETLVKLIEDARAESERLTAAHERASAESIDFTLSEEDREEAAANAGRYARSLAALATAIEEIEAKLDAKRNSDAQRAKQAEKASALAERDEIAARFAARVPALAGELVDLLKAVQANAERMRSAGVHEANAEWHARGVPGNGMRGVQQFAPFLQMKIPDFYGAGRVWPAQEIEAQRLASEVADQTRRDRLDAFALADREADAKAKAAEEYRRTHGRYEITVESSVEEPEAIVRFPEELVTGSIPAALGCWDRRELMIPHDIAKKLATVPKVKIKRLDAEAAQ